MATNTFSLQAQNKDYIDKLQRRHSKLAEYFENFLSHETRKLLVIELGNLLVNVLSVQQILTKLEGDLKSRYGGQDDSMFLSWADSRDKLTAALEDLKVIPETPNLLVFEFDKIMMDEEDMSVLKKIVDCLSVGSRWKKVVIIARGKKEMDTALENIESEKFCFLEEPIFDETSALIRNSRDLFLACSEGFLDVALELIENNADINQTNNYEYTPLHMAAMKGHEDIVEKLLQKGAKHLKNKNGYTPLHLAAYFGHDGVATTLLEHGANINILAEHEKSPLHCAVESGDNGIVRILLEHGADIHGRCWEGETALHLAAGNDNETVVNTLVAYGADVDAKDNNGETPLHWAVLLSGNLETIKMLIEMLSANLNAKRDDGVTPLELARRNKETEIGKEIVKYLESKGAISSTTDDNTL